MSEKMDTFREYLATMRRSSGFSQRKAAELIGVSQPAYCAWEAGTSLPTIPNLHRVIRVLYLNEAKCLELIANGEEYTGQDPMPEDVQTRKSVVQ